MPVTLTRFVFAAAIACAALPARGAGMPDYGTKNFSPGGAAPSYFTNENGAVLGIPEAENTDDGADAADRAASAAPEPRRADIKSAYRRGRFAGHESEARAEAHSRVKGRTSQAAEANRARTASNGRFINPRRSEHASQANARIGTARGGGTKSARSAPRHAAAKSWSRRG
jgi:hypothetical protein